MTSRISKTAIVYPNVTLGENTVVEDYCIIGHPLTDGSTPATVIGKNAHLRAMTIIYAGNQIGDHFQTGNKANIRESNHIGNDVSIGTLSVVEHHVKIGNGVRIHTCAFIPEYTELKDGSWVGPHAVLTNAKIPKSPDAKKNLKGPIVEKNAIIGANTTLSPAIHIGENSLLGSGTNAIQSIAANVIVTEKIQHRITERIK